MKRIFLFFCLACGTLLLQAQQYTLKELVEGRFSAKGIGQMESSADGMHYYQTDPENRAVIKYSYATGKAVDTLFNTRRARECTFDTFQGFLVSPDENRVLVYREREQIYRHSFKATYYYHDVRRNLVRKLTQNSSKQMIPTFSPDSKMLAYVADNNIWLAKFDFDTESQVTKDGEINKIINGSTDWVYEEEFGTTRLMEFSPDSKLLAFVRSDESQVREYQFQTFNRELYPGFYSYKYPKAGERNASVELRVFDIDSRTIRKMDLPLESDGYIPRITFTGNPDELVAMTLNRNQNRFDMYFVNPRSTVAKLVLREESNYYIDADLLNSIHFLSNRFTYLSEKEGYSQIYIYGFTGTLQKKLTTGQYDVTTLLAVDEQTQTLFYEAADESPLRRNVYRINIDKGQPQKLSVRQGYNQASFSNHGKFFVNRFSDTRTPPLITLHDATGKELRVLEDNGQLAAQLAAAQLPQKEFITVPAADGITQLNGWIIKPVRFDASRKYPVVMIQYSGPNSQQVLDRFGTDWYYALANEGFVVASVDGRGTGARGEAFRKQTYMNLGVMESDDQVAAGRYLASLPYVDGNRIGIWGWSYGGYNVLMSMSRGNGFFKAGVAIAPVTDWKFYDSVYTERFMRTPQQNAAGYADGSAISLASRLEGQLLLVHGMADDNVHFQNSVEYSRALIAAGKHFEMFFFPDKNHSIYGGNSRLYLYEKVIDFYRKNL
ncbi:S9 family peptidase [Petrimonas mucosa]|jgi:dipeptidyl-peptidase-4|uniref:Prolyl endopeptidase FAP n=3 Tax=Petrimonas TaxID=307628 RepID=A0A1G4G5Y2_9BACT|nr:S9 family peptidase [Petrimonas mucosa]MDD3560258.1 S9 family peptidase [Petrimonas mucosa]SCM56864.1 Prolyl endopeptidase FAP {ECO:0000250/UniProtKB:Q12884} [Petrimonas mucosa]SFU38445.1 dipeptidyl-peptidase-4 [Porphyromonadaceae bacterium KHP3R9]HHT30725.1 S9 family peptidase [Petrimonas mucosa]